MTLNYPCNANGMYILSRTDIEYIADRILREYMPEALRGERAIDIVALAEEGLNLTITELTLDTDEKVLGALYIEDSGDIACFDETGVPNTVKARAGTIVINVPLNGKLSMERKRFTIAHECAHWILHRAYRALAKRRFRIAAQEPPNVVCRGMGAEQTRHELKTDEDWAEWQANTLASALLMPNQSVREYAERYLSFWDLDSFPEGGYSRARIEAVDGISSRFMVSTRAAELRLTQLGLIQRAPAQPKPAVYSQPNPRYNAPDPELGAWLFNSTYLGKFSTRGGQEWINQIVRYMVRLQRSA